MTVIFEEGDVVGGRFTILSLLGAGGMGAVYHSTDRVRGHDVALKFALPSEEGSDRNVFLRCEAEALKRLAHAAIPKLFDEGTDDNGLAYFSMEYFEATSLRSLIASSELPPLEVRMKWLEELCDILAHIHQRGFLYCDLKPDNILVLSKPTAGMQIRLVDFGIATPAGHEPLEEVLKARGTTAYMSPEQHRRKVLDARSDIYSFGVVAFELLTGTRPFAVSHEMATDIAQEVKLSYMHMGAKRPAARERNADVPKDLSLLIEVCMARSRKERFDTIVELQECLQDISSRPKRYLDFSRRLRSYFRDLLP